MDLAQPPQEAPGAEQRKQTLQAAIDKERRAVLIVNTKSRRGRRLFADAQQLLRERGVTLDLAQAVREPSRVPELVSEAIGQGHRLVVVGGGDGTISSVVGAFAFRDVVLAILPVGTANSFARAAGVPLELSAAVDVAVGGKVADVDLGQINDHYFANAAAIGLPASIARHMPARLKRWFGRVGYLIVAMVRLCRHRPFRCTLTIGERRVGFDALEARIANGQYQGGVAVADEASVESRDLVVQTIKGHSRWSIVRFWLRAAVGLPLHAHDVEIARAAEFELNCEPAQHVSIDGEPAARTPVRARIARQALLVRVPRDQNEIQ